MTLSSAAKTGRKIAGKIATSAEMAILSFSIPVCKISQLQTLSQPKTAGNLQKIKNGRNGNFAARQTTFSH
jgi:hypothetical protein